MTQDMKKDTILHKIGQLIVPLKRTVSPLEADSHSAPGGHFFNRSLLLLLLMLTFGSIKTWGVVDFSGIWYIANETNHSNDNIGTHWYLVPGRDPKQAHYADAYFNDQYCNTSGSGDYTGDNNGDPEKPFLTTYQTGQDLNSIWIVVSTGDGYYNIIHAKTGKYIVYEPPYQEATNRKSMHLESTTTPGDNAKFAITGSLSGPINIRPVNVTSGNQFFNPAVGVGNRQQYYGTGADYFHEGMIGLYSGSGDKSQWYLEKAGPIITFASDGKVQINSSVPSTVSSSSSIYYTTDGGTPTTDSSPYTSEFTPSENATCIKAIVVINGVTSGVSYVPVLPGSARTYLFKSMGYQSTEQDGFFMQPGDRDNNSNITVTTSSLARPLMQWYFLSAGTDNDHQYYYIVNQQDESVNYLFGNSSGVIYMKTSSDFENSKTGSDYDSASDDYKFRILIDASDGFRIVPKAKQTVWIYKNKGNNTTDVVGTNNNATNLECRWDFIPVFDHKMPVSLTYDSTNPNDANWPTFLSTSTTTKYFKIENVGTADRYICPPEGTAAVGTATTGDNELAWYVVEAGHDDWRKYYYIVHASTGKYLKFNQTISNPPSSMQGKNSVLSLLDYDSSASDRYQFVFAKSTVDGGYYIVPKGLEDATYSSYYALYLDGTNPIKSAKNRASDSYKWKFVAADLFCNDPVFEESGGNIIISCNTNASEIRYTTNGDNPKDSGVEYSTYPPATPLDASDQLVIKAYAVVSDGVNSASSINVVTLLNMPDITLTESEGGNAVTDDTYTYDGSAKLPFVSEVSFGEAPNKTTATAGTDYETVIDTDYSNNINAGTAKVTLRDKESSVYVWHAEKEFTIKKAPLTVTANNHSITYGDEPTGNGVQYSGFVNDETKSVIDDENLAYDYTYEQYGDVGEYAITPKGLSSDNYEFDYVNGTLTVIKKEVGLTWNPSDSSTPIATYDGQSHAPTVTANAADLVNGDDISVTVTPSANEGSSLTGTVAINAGSYTATASGLTGTKAGNYSLPDENSQTFTISPKPVTVSGIKVSDKIYDGTTDATIDISGAAIDEKVPGDNLSVASVTGTFDTKDVGTDKTVTVAITTEGTSVGNYELSASGLTANITPKQLTITANDHTIGYGSEAVGNGVTYDSFVVGEDEILEGTLTYVFNTSADGTGDAYTPSSPKGTYYIIPGGLHLPDGNNNYTITFDYGILTVGPRKIGNGTDLAEGFTVNIDTSENPYALTVYDGSTELIQGTTGTDYDYSLDTSTSTDKYYVATITGANNYSDAVADRAIVKYAKVRFDSDGSPGSMWYGTFVAEADHATPAGMTPYIITSVVDNTATAVKLDYIPNGVPVVLMNPEDAKGFLVQSGTGEISTTGNLLAVQATDGEKATATVYLLYKGEFVLNKAGTLKAGTVYLPVSSGSGARLKISRGGNTGIENIEYTIDSQSGAWYTLDGRRLSSKPTKKGVYLQGGKKIVVK